MVTALNNKKLLKGQIDLLKTAAANRKATQEAYEKIIQAKQVFVPEDNPAFVKKPAEGKDIYSTMFEKHSEPTKPKFPESTIRIPQTCLDRVMVMGFKSPVIAELLGWQHNTLGWRVTDFITHSHTDDLGLTSTRFLKEVASPIWGSFAVGPMTLN